MENKHPRGFLHQVGTRGTQSQTLLNAKLRNCGSQGGARGMLAAVLERTLRDVGIIVDGKAEGFPLDEIEYQASAKWILYTGRKSAAGYEIEHGFTAEEVFEYLGLNLNYLKRLRRSLRN